MGDNLPMATRIPFSIAKRDEEKRLVTGWASVVTDSDGNGIVDSQGDVIKIDDLETAVFRSFADGGLSRGKVMHNGSPAADIVEWWIVSKEKMEKLLKQPYSGPEGLWATFRVNDDATWEAVKAGSLPELSIGGSGRTTEL